MRVKAIEVSLKFVVTVKKGLVFHCFLSNTVWKKRRSPHGVVVNMLNWDYVISEFEFQWCYNIHFRTYTPGKRMNSLMPPHQLWVK